MFFKVKEQRKRKKKRGEKKRGGSSSIVLECETRPSSRHLAQLKNLQEEEKKKEELKFFCNGPLKRKEKRKRRDRMLQCFACVRAEFEQKSYRLV